MEKEMLRKVQMAQLDIAKEIKRVCDENDIKYFLDSGTLIGAIRHKGFIPWDDDLDIGMLRCDYEKFCNIVDRELGSDYTWQSWHTDENYAHPFGKVRKKNTIYIEERGGRKLKEKGFYVDVFPFDFAPKNKKERDRLVKQRVHLARMILMKCNYKIWQNAGKTDFVKRIGYLCYQIMACFSSHKKLVEKYEKLVKNVPENSVVYEQIGKMNTHYYDVDWLNDVQLCKFEDAEFNIPIGTHERLTEEYGDYMQLPPKSQRENRHSIIEIKF
ncbi:LicD family protein [Kineothrix sp. MSJ-39]|uniref:LicD family protein n=1 Tax=Kineothrix sp. MSJ-39 TaxID=2841533 RepID=UPI001C12094B|nr:LicD family protein [Kineothrix sp. MSJ-39]MBU5430651.1 LicD family protein [Kineothrix sp. MSJ-39]